MLVKICGISNYLDAMTAVQAGASAVGFVMGGKVLPVEVEPLAQQVREIIKQFPPEVDSFLVTHLFDADDIVDLSNYVRSSGIQISEDVGLETVKAVRNKCKKKIIKTVPVRDQTSIEKLKTYEPYCDYILLDSSVAGYVGGTGVTSDWNLCREMIRSATKPVYLAGGLSPENVAEAIRQTDPHGVDVSTGISSYSPEYLRKDRKDAKKIETFISIARNMVKHAVS